LHTNGSSPARARWVVVVPLADATLFDYLTKSFASIPDVTVVLDRRRSRGGGEVLARDGAENRRAEASVVSSFGCAVIRRQPQGVPDESVPRRRTLLWPNLRLSDVLPWSEESALRGADTPPPNARTS
jgi:hypothetical protein